MRVLFVIALLALAACAQQQPLPPTDPFYVIQNCRVTAIWIGSQDLVCRVLLVER